MPYALVLGLSEDAFWDSSPKMLEPYEKAHEMREEMFDTHLWRLGQYVGSAVSCILADKKHNVKYVEKPFLTQMREEEAIRNMSEEEKQDKTELFFKSLISMQESFNKSRGA